MVKEIVILRDTGIPLFHYSVYGSKKLDEIVSAFLSAIGSLVEQSGQEQLTVMSFAESKFVWVKKGDLFFIALVSQEDSAEIYRVILTEMAEQFVSKFYAELKKEDVLFRDFRIFTDSVEMTLQKFDGIPSLARRYDTALLPPDDLRQMKIVLSEIEAHESISRGGLLTWDGHIVVSNLRAYELEAILDLLDSFNDKGVEDSMMVVHTSLDPVSSFFINKCDIGICTFVVKAGQDMEYYRNLIAPFMKTIDRIDFGQMRLLHREQSDEPGSFYEHDAVELLIPADDALSRSRAIFDDMPEETQSVAIKILRMADGKKTVGEIAEQSSIPKGRLSEALAILISKGVAQIAKLYPVMDERDDRFSAYLEVIGIPKRDYDIIDAIWQYCDGSLSLSEISARTSISVPRIMEVLKALGKYVDWQTTRVLRYVR
ncbi:hypothetical protein EU545_03275 [Candidatus Thorarchaeota archaeon]|nr:MAG: hypothetical protein EU545_03275 [Candidatus Thorarchaeota archaeon]